MKLLALDTSSLACSVAALNGDNIEEQHEELERQHTRLLMPMVKKSLKTVGLNLKELDAIVLGNGPGSFIGMRIAAAVAQGLAHGSGLPIVPVSSLAAIAAEVFASTDAEEVVVAQDAHMDEVYLGLFRRDDTVLPVAIAEERLQTIAKIDELEKAPIGRRAYAGKGWHRYPALLALNSACLDFEAPVVVPHARYLLKIASLDRAVPPQDVLPTYLRHQVAVPPQKKSL